MTWWAQPAAADGCPYTAPYSVPLDLMQQAPLAYTRDLRVFNVYWHGNDWDQVARHKPNPATGSIGFHTKDIDAATQALLIPATSTRPASMLFPGSSGPAATTTANF